MIDVAYKFGNISFVLFAAHQIPLYNTNTIGLVSCFLCYKYKNIQLDLL